MTVRLLAVMLLVFVVCVWQTVQAETAPRSPGQRPGKGTTEAGQGDAFVSVITQHTGGPLLVIRYPWKRHALPSVEVRVLAEDEVDNRLLRPLFFQRRIMKGGITEAVYHCQDRSEGVRQTATFLKDNIDFDIFGARNSLGRPSVCVACRTTTVDPPPETRAAFCLLDAWALDERTLNLELPAKYFSEPGKIRVWLIRDKDIVWTATTTWPGASERSP
jgi:hypothetical protein